jgi:hypothetical protein
MSKGKVIGFVSKDVQTLEKRIKDFYGRKRGAAMIEAARQNVEYNIDKQKMTQIEFTKLYVQQLEQKL